jgi:hypothetical protein
MLMLLGAVLSDVLRSISGPVVGVKFSGAFGAGGGWDTGGSSVAALGVAVVIIVVVGGMALVEACEGARATMVGTGVGLGAGRV